MEETACVDGPLESLDLLDVSGWDFYVPILSGEFAIELCCGEAVVTLGLLMSKVPCLKPWDTLYGEKFDLLSNGWRLLQLVEAKCIVVAHLAPPCQTFSWARFPPLRSWDHVQGLPHLNDKQLESVVQGNDVANFCAQFCLQLYLAGGYFQLKILDCHGCGRLSGLCVCTHLME